MKRPVLSILTLLLIICTGCNDDSPALIKNEAPTASNPLLRTEADAIKMAIDGQGMLDSSPASRSTLRTVKNVGVIGHTTTLSRSASVTDTLLYIVNFDNDNGFAIVPAPKSVPGIFAITESGNYDVATGSDCPGLEQYLALARDYASKALEEDMLADIVKSRDLVFDTTHKYNPDPNIHPWETKEEETSRPISVYGPRLLVNWHCKNIYGSLLPYGYAGCGSIAVAQAMTYFNHPTKINMTYDNSGMINLDWGKITLHNWERNCKCGDDAETIHSTIAKLIFQIGKDTKAEFAPHDHSIYQGSNIIQALINYGFNVPVYKGYSAGDSKTMIGGMILMMGFSAPVNQTDNAISGHIWLIDGVKQDEVTHTCYYRKNSGDAWKIMSQQKYNVIYNYNNWGLSLKYNGWYQDCVYQPKSYGTEYKYDARYMLIKL